jgi:hypothetical protein
MLKNLKMNFRASRIFSYTPRTELSILKLDSENYVNSTNNELRELYNENLENKKHKNKVEVMGYKSGEKVLYISRSPGYVVGLKAKIIKKNSPLTYWVEIEGKKRLAHVNQLRKIVTENKIINMPNVEEIFFDKNVGTKELGTTAESESQSRGDDTKSQERPRRIRKPVERLTYK